MGESTTLCNADSLAILRGVNELRAVDQGKYEKRRGNKCKGRGEREVIYLLGGLVLGREGRLGGMGLWMWMLSGGRAEIGSWALARVGMSLGFVAVSRLMFVHKQN